MKLKEYNLKVRELHGSDMYKDMVRVYWDERGGVNNGAITRVSVNGGKPFLLAMRGCLPKDKGTIALDHLNRDYMKLKDGNSYLFTFEHASWREKLRWARNSADPAARIATWIAIVSGLFGVVGLLLGIIGTYPVAKEIWKDFHPASVTIKDDKK